MVAVYGWQGLLTPGGVLPLILAPMLYALLPESVRFLALRGAASARIAAVLKRIAPDLDCTNATFTGVHRPQGMPMLQLFTEGHAFGTILIWLTFFMSLLVFYLLSSWLALLITSAGFTMADASLMAATLAAGGTFGALLIGWLMDRFDPHTVLSGAYLLAGGFVILLGSSTGSPVLLVFAIFGAGFGVAGAQTGTNALAAAYYPTASRATGVSWANAVGRTGLIVGSMIGGVLLSMGWALPTIFTVAAVPAFLAGVAILAKRWTTQPTPAPAMLPMRAE